MENIIGCCQLGNNEAAIYKYLDEYFYAMQRKLLFLLVVYLLFGLFGRVRVGYLSFFHCEKYLCLECFLPG